jgi:hypothetical protein
VGQAAYKRHMKNVSKNLATKPEGKKPLGKPRHRWE